MGCVQASPRILKIGLVAPFEGRYREIGGDVIPAARLAIREWATRSQQAGIAIELVAYDDAGDPSQAIDQARRLASDPDVQVVIGHWLDQTTLAALPIYEEAGLPLITFMEGEPESASGIYNLAPSRDRVWTAAETWASQQDQAGTATPVGCADLAARADELVTERGVAADVPILIGSLCGLNQFYKLTEGRADGVYFMSGFAQPADMLGTHWTPEQVTQFVAGYSEGSLGNPPGLLAAVAYEATWVAIEQVMASQGIATGQTPASGLRFDTTGRRVDAPIYLYRWMDGQRSLIAAIQ